MTPNAHIGEVPTIDWISVDLIDVDRTYQRPEDEKRVARIVETFRWDRFGAVVLSPRDGGRYAIIDGQHRARAAQLHPEVDFIPAVLIATEDIPAEAVAFVGINSERKNTSALELHFAQLAAGDEDAATIAQVCERAGVRIPRYTGAGWKPRDTIAIGAIQSLINRRGAMRAREYLELLTTAEFAPITASQIKAIEALMHDPEFAGQVTLDDLQTAVIALGGAAEAEGKRFAAIHCVPTWRGLAATWFQKCRKRRSPPAVLPPGPAARAPATASAPAARPVHAFPARPAAASPARLIRPIAPARPGMTTTAAAFGDPEPGRSALAQKEASRG